MVLPSIFRIVRAYYYYQYNTFKKIRYLGVETDASSSAGGGQNNRDSDSGVGTCSPPTTRRRSPSPSTTTSGLGHRIVARKNLALGGLSHQPPPPSCSLPSPSGNGKSCNV